ncbi:MAG: peptidylprolyl isomerase [Planctomycetes bacterium]|nr:peptidylprolyl isomerase [Planctomycetota bacterium]
MAKKRRPPAWVGLESLESRDLLSAVLTSPFSNLQASVNQATSSIDLVPHFDDPTVTGKVVKFDTVMGAFYAELYNVANGSKSAAPLSVAQFLNHANNALLPNSNTTRFSSYDNTLISRVDTGTGLIQGGGYDYPTFETLPIGPTVVGEYSDTRPNVRGTIGWARNSSPNSATNQWYINTEDNTTGLGSSNNGGYTVFGQVLGSGMTVVDAIAALPVFNADALNPDIGSQFPLRNTPPVQAGDNNVVLINSIRETTELAFTASSSNTGLVKTSILDDGTLLLDFGLNQTGTATITVVATDRAGALTQTSFDITVGAASNPPTIAALTPSLTGVARGKSVTLTATGVADASPGTIDRVEFFIDSNSNGTLDPGADTKLGIGTLASGAWTLTTTTAGLPTGDAHFFARAVDNLNQSSDPVTTLVAVTNTPPTLSKIQTLGTIQRNTPATISYETLANYSNEADANGDTIRFRIDQVVSGTLTKGGQPVVPGTTTIGPGESVVWTPALDADGTLSGFVFRASDGEATSTGTATFKLIVNKPPTVSSLTAKPVPLVQPGAYLTLTAKPADADGTVTLVEFYYDTNNNGVLDVGTDLKLGQDNNKSSGWSLVTNSTSLIATGQARYFARATDNTGQTSTAASLISQVNAPPTLGVFSGNPPVARPGSLTLTLADVVDDGSIKSVEFFLDLDGTNQINGVNPSLGKASRQTGTSTYSRTISSTNIPAGETRFIAKVTDNLGAVTTKSVVVTVTPNPDNTAPNLSSLTIKPAVVNRSAGISLAAGGVSDPHGSVKVVEFYKDNGDGLFDPATDTLIGRDFSSKKGWAAAYVIPGNQATGPLKFFARAVDLDGATSTAAVKEIIVNPPPTIAALAGPASIARGATLTLSAITVADTLGGTIKSVEFYHDTNNNGILDSADKRVARGTRTGSTYAGHVSTSKLPLGVNRFFAVAIDDDFAYSAVVTTTLTIT